MSIKLRAFMFSALALLIVVIAFYVSGTISNANQTEERAIKQLVSDYLQAIQDKDLDAVMSLVIDKTYPNLEAQRKGYQEMLLNDEYYSADVLSTKKVDDNKYSAEVTVENKYTGKFNVVLDVVNTKEGWKILIEETQDVYPDAETQKKLDSNEL